MLTFEQIKELIELVAQHRLAGVDLEKTGFRLKVDGYPAPGLAAAAAPASPAPAPAPASHHGVAFAQAEPPALPAAPAPTPVEKAPEDTGGHVLTSPIVGTYYRSPNPQSPAFVEVGDKVTKGQVLCIIEAMKLMNEIESDVSGEIVRVLIENGQPVEYGQGLFAIRTAKKK